MANQRVKKNITLTADEHLIEKAREKAHGRKTTLNEEFRIWLRQYAGLDQEPASYQSLMKELSHVKAGGKFSREDLNAR